MKRISSAFTEFRQPYRSNTLVNPFFFSEGQKRCESFEWNCVNDCKCVCVGVCLWLRIIAPQLQSQQGSVYANANNYES